MKYLVNNNQNIIFNKKLNVYEITVNGMKFPSQSNDYFFIPEINLCGLNISMFPSNVTLVPYSCISDYEVQCSHRIMEIKNIGRGKTTVTIEACLDSIVFTKDMGVEVFQTLKKELILQQKHLHPKIINYIYSDGTAHLNYSIKLKVDEIQKIIEKTNSIDDEMNAKILKVVPDTLQIMRSTLKLPKAKKNV